MRTFKSRVVTGRAGFAFVMAAAAVAATHSLPARAQDVGADQTIEQVTVTARKRDETLIDVPISITAVTEDTMDRSGLRSVADIAPGVPGLNINSDSVGRAFVSIRGIGTALQAGVQPGVGIFQDGIYAPATSYINNPTLDIARIEVLRGPQGTLYGKNTLGGAINIITRPPGDSFEGKVFGSYSEGNETQEFGGRIGGPIGDSVRAKLAVATRDSDGFFTNKLIGGQVDASDSDQADASVIWDFNDDTRLTVNGYYLDFTGGATNYNAVTGTTDYRDNVQMNVIGRQTTKYTGGNAKLEFPLASLKTTVTAIAAYDKRDYTSVSDGDFLPLDIVRSNGAGIDETYTGELRFDTQFTDTFSTLIGLYANREESDASVAQLLVPANRVTTSIASTSGNTYSIFATGLWRFSEDWELSLGVRVDEEDRDRDSSLTVSTAPGVVLTDPPRSIDSSEVEPRVSLTRFFNPNTMMYASIAKGYRGGGFNAASVPAQFSTYDGDTVWTYEIGGKVASEDGRWFISSAIYYNDYTDFIGQNALAIGPGGGLVSIDLNLGDVESYGLETEAVAKITDLWALRGSVTLMHARITDQSGWIAVTGTPLATDRLLFQPDWNFSLSSDLNVPVGNGEIDWNLGVTGKGSRPGSSFDPTTPSILDSYYLVNTSLSYRLGGLTATVFANNLTDEKYFESFIDGSLLAALGLLNQDLGILGAPRNVGLRLQYEF
ncbi:iron complex outermembrane receptor protein [Povalibacter uvarum]|uniref:Iron complex outermembrane receptor protein n=1 Tax=Povalibacter uvarum TaxID=732238 RepID=A0A841HSQ2_9GAMM|nr:TonB-dependent receptor [Povalibacter uvarum]MBB6095916.1 iron complex outermembrane receptor protein [Povalibacter uvarum]